MRRNNSFKSVNKQRGNTLVIAVFVIVVLGGLVVALASLLRTSSESVVVEVLGTRSHLAAQSGLEQAMMTVYPLNEEPVTDCSVDGQNYEFPEDKSLQQCAASISCDSESYTNKADETFIHLTVTSIGVCKAGSQETSRQLQIETRVEN